MQGFERVFMRTLRHIYDTELQLAASVRAIAGHSPAPAFARTLREIEVQSVQQAQRIESIFTLLYLDPQPEASWATTALLRDAWDSCSGNTRFGAQGCAAALLAVKRYEITLYEALLRWCEQYELVEPLPDIRRSIAEELVQASALSELAFEDVGAIRTPVISRPEPTALH
jgi:ferritin-like metal-binding protein YciE